jgi:hypothetical protein
MPTRGTASIGLGSVVAVDDNGNGVLPGNGTFVSLVNVESLAIPSNKLGTQESKTLDIANATMNRIPGIFDPGSGLTITWELVNSGATGNGTVGQYSRLEALKLARAGCPWRFSVARDSGNFTNITQTAFVTENAIQAVTADGKTMVNTVLDLSGAPTVA